jgi:nucleoside phosphorylase
VLAPDRILLIGYAGALDPNLKVGDLVGVKKAFACSLDESDPELSHLQLDRQFELKDADAIADSAKSLGLHAGTGDALTSAYVLGVPEHKRLLFEKYNASIVDMETAALASVAISRNIPFSCARSISDGAGDAFLAPFSYNPSANLAARAAKIIGSGVQGYHEWKTKAKEAGDSLNRFLSRYL